MKALSDIADTAVFSRKLRVMTPHRHQHPQRSIMSRLHLACEAKALALCYTRPWLSLQDEKDRLVPGANPATVGSPRATSNRPEGRTRPKYDHDCMSSSAEILARQAPVDPPPRKQSGDHTRPPRGHHVLCAAAG
jgi:hypothetical protein